MTLVPLCLYYAIPRQCRQAIIKCSCSERQFKVIIGVASLATKSAFSHCQWLVFMSFISCEAVPHNEVKSFHLTSDLYFLVLAFSRDIYEILRSKSQETSCKRQEHRHKNHPSKLISSHCASMCNIWNFTHTCQKRQGYIFFRLRILLSGGIGFIGFEMSNQGIAKGEPLLCYLYTQQYFSVKNSWRY